MSGSGRHNNLPGDLGRGTGGKEHEFRIRAASVGGLFYDNRFCFCPDKPSASRSTEPPMAEREQSSRGTPSLVVSAWLLREAPLDEF